MRTKPTPEYCGAAAFANSKLAHVSGFVDEAGRSVFGSQGIFVGFPFLSGLDFQTTQLSYSFNFSGSFSNLPELSGEISAVPENPNSLNG